MLLCLDRNLIDCEEKSQTRVAPPDVPASVMPAGRRRFQEELPGLMVGHSLLSVRMVGLP